MLIYTMTEVFTNKIMFNGEKMIIFKKLYRTVETLKIKSVLKFAKKKKIN